MSSNAADPKRAGAAVRGGRPSNDAATALKSPRGHKANAFMNLTRGVQDILGLFVFGGVFERNPDLHMVVAEADAGWVPHWMYRSDHAAVRWGSAMQCGARASSSVTSRSRSCCPTCWFSTIAAVWDR